MSTHCPPQHVGPGLPGAKHTAADFLEQAAYGGGDTALLASRKRLLLVACWRPAGIVTVAPAPVTMAAVAAASKVSRTTMILAMVERTSVLSLSPKRDGEFVCWECLRNDLRRLYTEVKVMVDL